MSYQIDKQRWARLNIFEQMGNIYSEVGRSFAAKKRHDKTACDKAVERAVDLFNETINGLIAAKSPRAREVLRAKEEFLKIINDNRVSNEEIESLDHYFFHFAIAARLNS
ncbi:MAG: hypothetical protein ABSB12_03335 [Candidatus Saccharimonadales bacterium]|jgi:hypothetical protein